MTPSLRPSSAAEPERRSDDELRRRVAQQAAVAEFGREAMANADSLALAGRAVELVADELGVPFAIVLSPQDDGELAVRAHVGMPADFDRLEAVPEGHGSQSRYTLELAESVVSRDLEDEHRFTPSPGLLAHGARSSVTVPVGVFGRPLGVLGVASRRADAFSDDDVNFLQGLANTLGAAVERERAEDEIRAEHARLEAALRQASEGEARFREMADAAPVFIWTADTDGMVDFINRGWLDYTGRTMEEELGNSWEVGVHPDDQEGVRTSWWRALRRRVPWEREYRLRRHDGEYRWIVDRGVPRFDGPQLLGYVGTATDIHERKQMEQKLSEAYERDHQVAETLQRSLLPERLPRIDGVELEARYLPASRSAAIGGDWYDAIELDDGRVAVVVGDVVGHGLRAAVVMGQMRTAFRAYAMLEDSPAETLGRLNRLLMKESGELMATALFLLLDRDTGELCYSSAGHPPALVVRRGGEPRYLEGGRSVPLGTSEGSTFRQEADIVEAGSTLLLYTDGLVERRDTPLEDRLAQLSTVAAIADGELGDVCDQILGGVLGGNRPSDDVALLAIRPAPPAAGSISLRLPADPAALAQLRRRMSRFLQSAGASRDEEFEITLAVSEAAMNAIEHAYGTAEAEFELKARVAGGEFTAEVRDHGRWRAPREGDRGRGLTIMHDLMQDVAVSPEPNGTTVRMRRRVGGEGFA